MATMKLVEMLEKRNEALKVSQVARILGVTPQHIYKMAAAGLIPCFHVKGAIRFWPSELAQWIRKELERAEQERNANGKGNVLKHGHLNLPAFFYPLRGTQPGRHCRPVLFHPKNHSIPSMPLFAFNLPESGSHISASEYPEVQQ